MLLGVAFSVAPDPRLHRMQLLFKEPQSLQNGKLSYTFFLGPWFPNESGVGYEYQQSYLSVWRQTKRSPDYTGCNLIGFGSVSITIHICKLSYQKGFKMAFFKLYVTLLVFGSYALPHIYHISTQDALQDYLCNGSWLQGNVTLVLEAGEHRISSGTFCSIANVSNILITGSLMNDVTVVRCQGEGGFGFFRYEI